MVKPSLGNLASTDILQAAAQPMRSDFSSVEMGEAGGRESLARLNEAVKELRAVAAAPVLQRAITCLNREDFVAGGRWAVKALEIDQENGVGWYLLAIARERAGDFANSVRAYEAALHFLPDHAEVANDLGRLAFRMGMHEQAEKLFRRFMEHAPERPDGVNNLVTAIREQGRTDEAIEILKEAIQAYPESPMLWNTLGSIMIDLADYENAFTFFGEAIRLDPKFGKARYNLSQVKHAVGDTEGALADCMAALKRINTAEDRQMMLMAKSTYQLVLGRLGEGWDDYEARVSGQFAGATLFLIDRPRWKPGAKIQGKRLLIVAEQGLGDEILFANLLPDVIERVGPEGRIQLAVERRLVDLFQRSFPTVEVSAHQTNVYAASIVRSMPGVDMKQVDLWTPLGSLLREFRRSIEAFPAHDGYMKPDPERVAHWRKVLADAPPGPKVGLLWKSRITKGRARFFSRFEQWEPVLRTPGVSFVNLQYGDCAEDIAQAKSDFGVDIWTPPGIDLKDDLDDVAALCKAMDLTMGFANATFNIAASTGAPSWLISTPGSWPRLGTDRYPWYPQTRVFLPDSQGDWESVMTKMAGALQDYVTAR